MAAALAAAGVTRGSSVHVALRNCPAFIAIWLACARSGAWLVPVDPTSTARDIGRQIDRVRPAAGICAASRADVYAAGVSESAADSLATLELTETAADVSPAVRPGAAAPCPAVAPADRLAVMFTSGTTAGAEGRRAHAGQLRVRRRPMAAAPRCGPEHRWLVMLPLFHANASTTALRRRSRPAPASP